MHAATTGVEKMLLICTTLITILTITLIKGDRRDHNTLRSSCSLFYKVFFQNDEMLYQYIYACNGDFGIFITLSSTQHFDIPIKALTAPIVHYLVGRTL